MTVVGHTGSRRALIRLRRLSLDYRCLVCSIIRGGIDLRWMRAPIP